MILADTSVWVDHFRKRDPELHRQLEHNNICTHPLVVAELALGNMVNRQTTIAYLDLLPVAKTAQTHEVRHMIEARSLFRRGIGYVDAHLIASTLITPHTALWTRDRCLRGIAESLGISADLA